jgi:hypothetical protein
LSCGPFSRNVRIPKTPKMANPLEQAFSSHPKSVKNLHVFAQDGHSREVCGRCGPTVRGHQLSAAFWIRRCDRLDQVLGISRPFCRRTPAKRPPRKVHRRFVGRPPLGRRPAAPGSKAFQAHHMQLGQEWSRPASLLTRGVRPNSPQAHLGAPQRFDAPGSKPGNNPPGDPRSCKSLRL